MPKSYYNKEGSAFYYTAMCTADGHRKMDLPEERVAQREKAGRIFCLGWVERLERLKVIVRIEYMHEKFLWLVDSEAAANVLGCRPNSVLKYLEIMRYIRFVPRSLETLPEEYGYMRRNYRQQPPTDIVCVNHDHDDNVDASDNDDDDCEVEPPSIEELSSSEGDDDDDFDMYDFIDTIPQARDDMYELPSVIEDDLFYYYFFFFVVVF
jgi:hypothetical protein